MAVDRVSIDLRRGETFGLVGPNGAGKTTTLRMLAGLIAPTTGRIELEGQPVSPRQRAAPAPPGGAAHRIPGPVGPAERAAEPDDLRPAVRAAPARPRRGRRARTVRPARPRRRRRGSAVQGTPPAGCAGADAPARSGHRAAGRADVGTGPRKRARRPRSGAPAADRGPGRGGVHAQPRRGGASGDARRRPAHAHAGRSTRRRPCAPGCSARACAWCSTARPRRSRPCCEQEASPTCARRAARCRSLRAVLSLQAVRRPRPTSCGCSSKPARASNRWCPDTPSLEDVYLRVLDGGGGS